MVPRATLTTTTAKQKGHFFYFSVYFAKPLWLWTLAYLDRTFRPYDENGRKSIEKQFTQLISLSQISFFLCQK